LDLTPSPRALCPPSSLCVTIHANPASRWSCILSLRYKSRQSRHHFVMHLSSALQIGPILAVLCHALQLALQIGPILAVLCHALQLALQITPILAALCHAS